MARIRPGGGWPGELSRSRRLPGSILLANGVFQLWDSWLAVVSEIGLVLLLLGGVAAMRGRTSTAAESSVDAEAQAINDWTRGLPFLPFVTVGVALLIALIAVSRGYSMTAVDLTPALC